MTGPDTDEWWAQLFLATHDAVDGVPYAASSEYPTPHIAAFRAAAEPLILPVVQLLAVEKAAEELRAAAADFAALADADWSVTRAGHVRFAAERLRARADDLDPSPETPNDKEPRP